MTSGGPRFRALVRRIVDTMRWVAATEELPDGTDGPGSRPMETPSGSRSVPGSGVSDRFRWLFSSDELPDISEPAGAPRDVGGTGWVRWLSAGESLPPAPADPSRDRDRRGFIRWLMASERLPESVDRSGREGDPRGD